MKWTWEGEPDVLLRRCIEAGMTFTEIGKAVSEKFGREVTRNAAIGRAHRLGIESRSTLEHRNEQARIGQGRARSPTKLGNHRTRIRGVEGPGSPAWAPELGPESVEMARPEIEALGLSLIELETGMCKWPVTGWPELGDTLFCGHPQREGKPYCQAHAAIAYHKPQENKRDRENPYLARAMRRRNNSARLVCEMLAANEDRTC